MVEGLTQMTIERLQLYQKKNRSFPDRIIVYRDGVSEVCFHLLRHASSCLCASCQGQYSQVLTVELPKLQAAFRQISPKAPYKPSLTIVVCGKRHHARFWPPDAQHASRNGNTVPGTVVDKGITDIYNYDFYLQVRRREPLIISLYSLTISPSPFASTRPTTVSKGTSGRRTTSSSTTTTNSSRT